jgi:hypothetical protein
LEVHETKNKKVKPAIDYKHAFGQSFTDHMLTIDYDIDTGGWGKP